MSIKENISKIAKTVTENAGSVAKTVSEGASNVVRTVGGRANVVAKKSGDLVELSKLTMSVKTEEAKLKNLHEELGKIICLKFKNNVYIDPELTDKCKEVLDIEKEITQMTDKILVLRNKNNLSNNDEKYDSQIKDEDDI